MNPQQVWEIIGYVGSALVLISLLMSSVIKLRIINTVGSLIFCVYAIAIKSYPTAVMNGALVVINIYFLTKILKTKKSFSVVEVSTEDASVKHFLDVSKEDIAKYFPSVSIDSSMKALLVYQDMTVAGLFVGEANAEGMNVVLDYSTPQYRDCSVGRKVYDTLKNMNVKKLIYKGNNETHTSYVKKMGFEELQGVYTKSL